ncbi:MAG: TetR family transcriptional regulator [Candidatus Marinimicrobia bacterium]|nr:TetR family transcriptional regulator [Candidatus Neomarinimicrobiota bacterium]
MVRDKEETKQKLVDAVGEIMLKGGYQDVGVNAVAKEAGVDKVLIYRYFDGLDGLLAEFADQQDYFSRLGEFVQMPESVETKSDAVELSKQVFIGQLRHARENTMLQQILLWELNETNPATQALAEKREAQGVSMLNELGKIVDFEKADFPAIGNLILGGIYYLVLRSRNVKEYSGINLQSDEGWERMEHAIEQIMDMVMERI